MRLKEGRMPTHVTKDINTMEIETTTTYRDTQIYVKFLLRVSVSYNISWKLCKIMYYVNLSLLSVTT